EHREVAEILNPLQFRFDETRGRLPMDLEVFRPNAELEPAWLGGQGRQACGRQGNQVPLHLHALGLRAARQKVHAGAANEPADEGVAGILEELLRAPELKYAPLVHD